MIKTIQQKILQSRGKSSWHKPQVGVYHSSTVGERCLRKSYFSHLYEEKIGEKTLFLFEVGNIFHRYIQSFFPKGNTEKKIKVPIKIKKPSQQWVIIGKVDLIESDILVELKTVDTLAKALPFPSHLDQMECYLRGIPEAKEGTLIYIQKKDFEMASFPVKRNDERWKKIVVRISKLHKFLENKEVPESFKSGICRYCVHSWRCKQS